MPKLFDFSQIATVEFGVCVEAEPKEQYYLVPINAKVKEALAAMLTSTKEQLTTERSLKNLDRYQPSDKHASIDCCQLPLIDPMNRRLEDLYEATNIATNPASLSDPDSLVYYFASFHDKNGNKLLAIKRAVQFRGIVKAGNAIVRMIDETLNLIEDDVFKLDRDFDYFICDSTIYILRPSAFEYTADIESFVLQKAAQNALDLGKTITFLECAQLSSYVQGHKRAARLLASIRSRDDLGDTSRTRLESACRDNKIELVKSGRKIAPAPGHEMAFLQLLDRRSYTIELTSKGKEFYEATSRRSVRS